MFQHLSRRFVRLAFPVLGASLGLLLAATPAAAQVGVGIKGGLVFPDFSSDDFNADNRNGWQAGLFVGGNRDGVLGVQGEINYVRKEVADELGLGEVQLSYVQIPVLLRLNAGSRSRGGAALYGIVGPSFSAKVGESISGFDFDTDAFEGVDIALMFGGGVELGRFLVEGRYSRGLRQVNKNFSDFTEIKVHSFAVLVGVRLN